MAGGYYTALQTPAPCATDSPWGGGEPTGHSHGICVKRVTFRGASLYPGVETAESLCIFEGRMAAVPHRPADKGMRHPQVRMQVGTGSCVSILVLSV